MTPPPDEHQHLNGEQVDEAARAALDGREPPPGANACGECDDRIAAQGRYLSLARLLTRDTRAPSGTPAVEAVRSIRRRSYRRRAVREVVSLLSAGSVKTGV